MPISNLQITGKELMFALQSFLFSILFPISLWLIRNLKKNILAFFSFFKIMTYGEKYSSYVSYFLDDQSCKELIFIRFY